MSDRDQRHSSDRAVVHGGEMIERRRIVNEDRFVIAIDGPAASGKSTVAAAVAQCLDALIFDTGAVYRALTLAALERGISPDDGERLAHLIEEIQIDVIPPSTGDGRQYDVLIDGRDVTWDVRDQRVDRAVSPVSAHPEVRRGLLELQRSIGRSGRVVMPGRDIGTVVIPDAQLKIWLDASIDERARRRQNELAQRGVQTTLEEVLSEMRDRDAYDSSRAEAPMEPAMDAEVIATGGRAVDEIVDHILALASRFTRVPCRQRSEGE
jgi:CMP/dCMP kinase